MPHLQMTYWVEKYTTIDEPSHEYVGILHNYMLEKSVSWKYEKMLDIWSK